MKTVIITNCTNRKRLDGLQPVVLKDECYSSIAAMAKAWKGQIDERPTTLMASSLYVGRSVSDARRVATKLDAKLMFASTGLGLIDGDQRCPPYNLTVAQDPNSIIPRLEKLGVCASDWWEAVNVTQSKGSALADLVSQPDIDLVLIALSSNYVQLIGEDLGKIRDTQIDKLRIFTSRPGIEMLLLGFERIADIINSLPFLQDSSLLQHGHRLFPRLVSFFHYCFVEVRNSTKVFRNCFSYVRVGQLGFPI